MGGQRRLDVENHSIPKIKNNIIITSAFNARTVLQQNFNVLHRIIIDSI